MEGDDPLIERETFSDKAAEGGQLEKSTMDSADSLGGGFLALGVKGSAPRAVTCAGRLAPTEYLEPVQGYVPYRHNTLLLRQYNMQGGQNCLLEAMMAATGMGIAALVNV